VLVCGVPPGACGCADWPTPVLGGDDAKARLAEVASERTAS